MRFGLLACALVALSGCAPSLKTAFDKDFAAPATCGDEFFVAQVDDTSMITFYRKGSVAEARDAGAPVTTTIALPDPGVDLFAAVGTGVSKLLVACTDVVDNGDAPHIANLYPANGGTATLTVDPADPMSATLHLDGVTFAEGDGSVAAPVLDWIDVPVDDTPMG